MKKILTVLSLVAVTSMLASSAFAACGNNTGRNTSTRPATSGGTTAGSSASVGTPR